LALAVALLAAGEILWLSAQRHLCPLPWTVYVGTALVVSSNWAGYLAGSGPPLGLFGWPLAALGAAVVLIFVAEIGRFSAPGHVTERLAVAVLTVTYVGVFMSFVVQLRFLGNGAWGIAAIASLVIVDKMADTGAYTVGRFIGRHPMAPTLSPGKTIEGACGGLLFACLGSAVMFYWLLPLMVAPAPAAAPGWGWIVFALLVAGAGMLGDLAESLLKRDAGCKDSSPWMPGFGGVLDVIDSLLMAAPAAYLCWALGLVGP
jgi:phosphatidate cytidylyltransferase